MISRIVIPDTLIEVSRLGYGTASLHRIFTSGNRDSLLSSVSEIGLSHFDTAPYYGYGLAEHDLGRHLKGRRNKFTIASKIGLYPNGSESLDMKSVLFRKALGRLFPKFSLPVVNFCVDRARDSLRDTLRRLQTDYLDFLFLHEPLIDLIDTDEMLKWMQVELSAGLVRAWGISGISNAVAPLVNSCHPLASIVQTKDSNDLKEADFLMIAGRPLQFTYGYLSGALKRNGIASISTEIPLALSRNSTGCILISAGDRKHLEEIVNISF